MDWRILYNPLAAFGKRNGLIAALGITILLTIVAWSGWVHLDGALDLHAYDKPIAAGLAIGESLIDWLVLSFALFGASKLFGGNSGSASYLAAVGLARFPYLLSAILVARQTPIGKALRAMVTQSKEGVILHPQAVMTPAMIIGAMLLLVLVAWSIVMLVLGYKEASKLSVGKAATSFVLAVVVAEVISKLLLTPLFHAFS